MKTEDYDKLKKLCDENGFELLTESPKENDKFYVVKKKDIWEGVEFVEIDGLGIRKIISTPYKNSEVLNFCSINDVEDGVFFAKFCKPSTEQAYIEQLKRIAFEKFGEIKEGEKFNTGYGIHTILPNHPEWHYNKHIDFLYYKGLIVYSKGVWASKLPERVKVEFVNDSWDDFCDYNEVGFVFKISKSVQTVKNAGQFLSKQLETYLNDTNNNQD